MRQLFKMVANVLFIAAGAVVTHSIPPGVVAVGNPARVVKQA